MGNRKYGERQKRILHWSDKGASKNRRRKEIVMIDKKYDCLDEKRMGKREKDRENSRKSVRWSAVPVAPQLVLVVCERERGSGPEGADDVCM